jgi:ActR/RegA family two-component response regulator
MIYLVDEDVKKLRAFKSELEFRGYEVIRIRDADEAFSALCNVRPADVTLVIVDIMLSANSDISASRFTRESTDNFLETGLVLLDDLVQHNPECFPKLACFLTYATNVGLVAKIDRAASKHGIPLLRKRTFLTAYEFADQIESIIRQRLPS